MCYWTRATTTVALGLLAFGARPAAGQTSPDFLFGEPTGTIGVRSGWVFASANSDLFTFVQDELTISRHDFDAPAIGMDVDFVMTPRASVVFGVDFSKSSTNSEYREFVDDRRLPITQTTDLREINISGSLKHKFISADRVPIPVLELPFV